MTLAHTKPASLFSTPNCTPQKRRRTCLYHDSEDEGGDLVRAELTTENLLRHTQLETPGATVLMPRGSASSQKSKTAATTTTSMADDKRALENYGIHMRTIKACPRPLAHHISTVVEKQRTGTSPTAKRISRFEPKFADLNESTFKSRLASLLFFRDQLDEEEAGTEELIINLLDVNLSKQWVEHPDGPSLSGPRPDVSIGYAAEGKIPRTAFNEDEERILNHDPLTNAPMLCPFLTAQYKSAEGSMAKAERQTARDGVAINNYMHSLLQRANMPLSPIDVQHWSATVDHEDMLLWVHWVEEDQQGRLQYYMKKIHKASLGSKRPGDEGAGMAEMRAHLRNILEYAQTRRVQRIKEIITAIGARPPRLGSNKRRVGFAQDTDEGYGGSTRRAGTSRAKQGPFQGEEDEDEDEDEDSDMVDELA